MRALSCSLALAVVVSFALRAQTPDSIRSPEVRTAGTAQRSVRPDLATVSVQFTAQGSSPAEAGRRLAARADSLRRALETLGIPRDSLVTRSRSYWWRGRLEVIASSRCVPRRVRQPGELGCDPVHDTTYRANDAVEVRIRDLSKIGAVLDTLMGRGMTDISPVQFMATDISSAQADALREATRGARTQAETIAEASGMQLGRVLSLSTALDYAQRYSPISLSGVTVAASGEVNPGTVVVGPSIPVSVTVYGRWELVPKR